MNGTALYAILDEPGLARLVDGSNAKVKVRTCGAGENWK